MPSAVSARSTDSALPARYQPAAPTRPALPRKRLVRFASSFASTAAIIDLGRAALRRRRISARCRGRAPARRRNRRPSAPLLTKMRPGAACISRVGATGAGNEERLGHAGGEQPLCRVGALGRDSPSPVAILAKPSARFLQRHRIGRDRAAVDAAVVGVVLGARHLLHRAAHHLLVGMVGADIAGMIDA